MHLGFTKRKNSQENLDLIQDFVQHTASGTSVEGSPPFEAVGHEEIAHYTEATHSNAQAQGEEIVVKLEASQDYHPDKVYEL